MRARNLILAVLGGGTLLGALGGLTVNTQMRPPPDQPWRHTLQKSDFDEESYQFVDSGPQDLSPTWYVDRLPTWKRDRLQQAIPAYLPMSEPDYADEPADEVPPADPTAPSAAQVLAAFDAAEAAQSAADAVRDASAPPAPATAAEQNTPSPAHDAPEGVEG
jgi:hypothetical protein